MPGPMAAGPTGGEGIVRRYEDGSSGDESPLWDCESEWSGGAPLRFPILAVTRQELAMGDQRRPLFEDSGDSKQQDQGQDISEEQDDVTVAKSSVVRVEPPSAVELRHATVAESGTSRPTRPTPPGSTQSKLSQAASVDITKETSSTSQEGERILSFPKQDISKDESYEEDPDRLNLKSILRMLEKPPGMDAYKHRWHMEHSCDVFHGRQPFSAVEIGFRRAMTARNHQAKVTVGPSGYFLGQRPRTMPMDSLQRTAFRPLEVLRPVSVSKSFDDRGRRPTAPPPTRDSNTQNHRHFNFRNLELQSPLRVSPLHERSRSFQAAPRKLKPVVKPSTARSWDGSYDRTISPTYCTDILRASALASPRDSAKALAIHSLSRKGRRNVHKEEADVWKAPSPVDSTKITNEIDTKQTEVLRVPQHVMESQEEKHVKFSMRKGKLTREDTFLSDMEPRYVDYALRQQNKMSREMNKLLKKSHNPTRPPANTPVPVTPEY
ncbi:Hypp8997 [Branchiostoma lanceolatum]|uniref:Hypp8997 protein n=1 Tax=Branchiostoma lanceolatum TaxID=7740 RepID=A0A8J9ZCF6_BRALA|nr:Hypp8997 [Branchiostoma lanceolatum]